jgi:MYXO-CTERM domain-containing protein
VRTRSRRPAALAAAALTLALVAGAPAAALAAAPDAATEDADPGAGSVSWAVDPADATGPDGRSWIEHEADPGGSAIEHVAVRNLGDTTTTFVLQAADGYVTDRGRFSMLAGDAESVAAGTWVELPGTVTVEPGGTAVVPVAITVPADATPGDHAAGIAAAVLSEGTTDDGARIGVESRVGIRVLIRVTGDLAPAVGLTDLTAGYTTSWNPFAPGVVTVEHRTTNTGNTRVAVAAQVHAAGRAAGPAAPVELLPGDGRTVATRVDGVWPLGPVRVRVALGATVQPDGTPVAPTAQEVVVWAVPWPQVLTVTGLALVAVAALAGRRRRTAVLDRVRQEAHAQGRAEALRPAGSDRQDDGGRAARGSGTVAPPTTPAPVGAEHRREDADR